MVVVGQILFILIWMKPTIPTIQTNKLNLNQKTLKMFIQRCKIQEVLIVSLINVAKIILKWVLILVQMDRAVHRDLMRGREMTRDSLVQLISRISNQIDQKFKNRVKRTDQHQVRRDENNHRCQQEPLDPGDNQRKHNHRQLHHQKICHTQKMIWNRKSHQNKNPNHNHVTVRVHYLAVRVWTIQNPEHPHRNQERLKFGLPANRK